MSFISFKELRCLYVRSKEMILPWVFAPGISRIGLPQLGQDLAKEVAMNFVSDAELLRKLQTSKQSDRLQQSLFRHEVFRNDASALAQEIQNTFSGFEKAGRGMLLEDAPMFALANALKIPGNFVAILDINPTPIYIRSLENDDVFNAQSVGENTKPQNNAERQPQVTPKSNSPGILKALLQAEKERKEWILEMRKNGANIFSAPVTSKTDAAQNLREALYLAIEAFEDRNQ